MIETKGQPHPLPAELVAIFTAALAGAPRSRQRRIGPSQLGTTCLRCLVHGLAQTEQTASSSWYAGVGTAVHHWAEVAVASHELAAIKAGAAERFECELGVTVGTITSPLHPLDSGEQLTITGTADLYDAATATVVDYKCLGTTSLREVAAGRVKSVYRHQLQLYGYGLEAAGRPVRWVVLMAIPRNHESLDACAWVVMPYDRADAMATLARAETWARIIAGSSLEVALGLAGPHSGTEFSCDAYPDAPAKPARVLPSTPGAFLGLG